MLGQVSSEPTPNKEPYPDQNGNSSVHIASAAVLQERQQTYWSKQGCKGCALGSMLAHSQQIDECRDYKDTTSDPDHTGESADDQAEHQNENGLHIFPPIKSLQTHLILSISHGEPPLYNPLMESSAERDPRVYFAAERTFLAWIRTGLALMGIGFAVARFGLFLRQLSPGLFTQAEHSTGVSVWSGVSLVALGVIVIVDAIVRHFQIVHQLSSGSWTAGRVSKSAVALALLLACLGAGMALYLLFIR